MDKIKFENGSTIEFIGKDGKYTDKDIIVSSMDMKDIVRSFTVKKIKPIKVYYVYAYQKNKLSNKWEKYLLTNSKNIFTEHLFWNTTKSKDKLKPFKTRREAFLWLQDRKKKWNEHLKEKFGKGDMKIYKKYKKGWYRSTKYKIVGEVIHYDFQRFN
jgi:hypothetical protein